MFYYAYCSEEIKDGECIKIGKDRECICAICQLDFGNVKKA